LLTQKLALWAHEVLPVLCWINAVWNVKVPHKEQMPQPGMTTSGRAAGRFPKRRHHRGRPLGCGAIILPGVMIGDRALIDAGRVVTRDIAGACREPSNHEPS
jgi:hypothetical protein